MRELIKFHFELLSHGQISETLLDIWYLGVYFENSLSWSLIQVYSSRLLSVADCFAKKWSSSAWHTLLAGKWCERGLLWFQLCDLSDFLLTNFDIWHLLQLKSFWGCSLCWQEDSTLVSDKALELDAALGSCTVQYREVQGQETEKFLSYFRPCIIPLDGKYSLRSGKSNGETYKISMLTCKGDHVVRVKEVSYVWSYINLVCN